MGGLDIVTFLLRTASVVATRESKRLSCPESQPGVKIDPLPFRKLDRRSELNDSYATRVFTTRRATPGNRNGPRARAKLIARASRSTNRVAASARSEVFYGWPGKTNGTQPPRFFFTVPSIATSAASAWASCAASSWFYRGALAAA